jgi:hypothetical protein
MNTYYMSGVGEMSKPILFSRRLPPDGVFRRLASIAEEQERKGGDPLYLVCVKYNKITRRYGNDVEIGMGESKNEEESRDDPSVYAKRGMQEELQVYVFDNIQPDSELSSESSSVFFIDASSVYYESWPAMAESGIKDRNEKTRAKAYVYLYGTYDSLQLMFRSFNHQNPVTRKDRISNLILMPLSEIVDIHNHCLQKEAECLLRQIREMEKTQEVMIMKMIDDLEM